MPTWVSNAGIWTPAKEKSILPADAEKGRMEAEIYEGPDRQAQLQLAEEKVDHLGMPAREDPEIIFRARQLGMTVDEFLHTHETPSVETVKVETAKKTYVQKHSPQAPKPGVQPQGGRSPERPESESGGFGEAPVSVKPVQN